MRRFWKRAIWGLVATCGLGAGAYMARPGYHRVLTPGLFGMTLSEGVFIDDPARAAEAAALIAQADAAAAGFFGPLRSTPIWVICTTPRCQTRFGIKPRGLAIGRRHILVAPKGVTATLLTHERVHIELRRHMGVRDMWDPRFPAWFDEGLASHISGDTRLVRPNDPRDADWIKQAVTFRDWGRLHAPDGANWPQTYGAAARLVAEIEATLGRAAYAGLSRRWAAAQTLTYF